MGTRTSGAAIAALALVLAGCTASPSTDTETGTEAELTLVAFDSCADTLAALRKAAARERSQTGFARDRLAKGTAPEAPAAAAPDSSLSGAKEHSGTNNHEAGVDEADLVKTDGKRIVTIVDGTLRVVDAETRRLAGTLNLTPALKDPGVYPSQLLLHGSRALVVASGGYAIPLLSDGAVAKPVHPYVDQPRSTLLQVELDGGPRVLGTLSVDGAYVDARQVDSVARVVVRSGPRLPYRYPDGLTDPAKVEQANRRMLAESTAEQWLPRYELTGGGRAETGRVPCDQVVRPAEFSGTSMLTIYSLDLASSLTGGDPLTVVADGETVYASGEHLYVAHQAQTWQGRRAGTIERTEVHQFDISKPGRPRHVASGVVPGALLNQYAMSEHDGHLRVATTSTQNEVDCCDQAPPTESAVYVLAAGGKRLSQVGKLGGLGKGERIFAVRFAGDRGYVVTFRQTDPVYSLDLRDPRRPRVTGELKINGYSAYLHPVDDKTLIGVGQDATGDGRQLGTQISVFDVADPARPRRVAQHRLPYSSSEAEFDPHAFLYWPEDGLIVVPINRHANVAFDTPQGIPSGDALVLSWRDGALTERGTVVHPATSTGGDSSIRRSLVIGETLWTVSAVGVRANRVADLSEVEWIPFR